ncbi:myosin-A [Hyalella azteca]|uniref:Myosin-A n=1 Tax=Hyalella azteca TaxID=294128 RepID=A0A979FKR1_HYAAZ|nr:myosin-A [Hyalella azteca]
MSNIQVENGEHVTIDYADDAGGRVDDVRKQNYCISSTTICLAKQDGAGSHVENWERSESEAESLGDFKSRFERYRRIFDTCEGSLNEQKQRDLQQRTNEVVVKESPKFSRAKSNGVFAEESPKLARTKSNGVFDKVSPKLARTKSNGVVVKESPKLARAKSNGVFAEVSPKLSRVKNNGDVDKVSPKLSRAKSNGVVDKESPNLSKENGVTSSFNIVSIELEPSKTTITSRLLVTPTIDVNDELPSMSFIDSKFNSNLGKDSIASSSTSPIVSRSNFSSQMPSTSIIKDSSCSSENSGITTVNIQAERYKENIFHINSAVENNLSSPSKTNVGPTLVSINPYTAVGNSLTLASTRGAPQKPHLLRVVHEAVRQQSETGYPQAVILSGTSGSRARPATRKLSYSQQSETGYPQAVILSGTSGSRVRPATLGLAKTDINSESSRIGHFIEVQVTDGALYRTKIHCYFLDQTRVVRPLPHEKNYHIFYQMLAGLTQEERERLQLEGHTVRSLRYLSGGDTRVNEAQDAARSDAEVRQGVEVDMQGGSHELKVRQGVEVDMQGGSHELKVRQGVEVDMQGGSHELKSVASLLGVSSGALYRGLVTRTHNARGHLVKSMCDANMSNLTRDALAKALYCRTVATIVRRANSLKRLGSTSGTLSSDSNESVHQNGDAASHHASTVGTGGSKASKSMSVLNSAVKHATDGFIGILDMFGFEDPKPSHLEHLCINLCAETMQHFYNTHIFKSSVESCREEGISSIVEVDYVDNVPCIDLISSLRTGLLSMLDVECSVRGSPESYVQKVKLQHKGCSRLFEPKSDLTRAFGIHHYAGRVVYEASDFLDTNRDIITDDLVCVFHKLTCSFGFATHLFGSEMKALFSQDAAPRGVSFRISPTSHTDLQNGDEPVSTLTQDFHTRLDNLLRTLVHAKPHFVRCLRANPTETPGLFDRPTVIKQIRALQVTLHLTNEGARQQLEMQRIDTRHRSATLIQAHWRGWHTRRRWPTLRRSLELRTRSQNVVRPRPQPITCTPPPEGLERCDHKTIQQTCDLFGLDLERPPPVPPSRSYTIAGNQKLGYPQTRVLKMAFTEDGGGDAVLVKGDVVMVVGASHRRGHVMVEYQGISVHVPYQYLEAPQPPPLPRVPSAAPPS